MTESLKRGLLSDLRVKGRLPTYINRRIIVIYCHWNKGLLLASPLSGKATTRMYKARMHSPTVDRESRPGSCPLGDGGLVARLSQIRLDKARIPRNERAAPVKLVFLVSIYLVSTGGRKLDA